MFVSAPNLVPKHGQFPAVSFSYHDLIFLSYNIQLPRAKKVTVLRRNFGGVDKERLCDDARNINWMPVLNAESIDDKVQNFSLLITQLYDRHAPLRPVKLKQAPSPWLTPEIRLLIKKKNRAKAKLRSCKSDDKREKYKKIRNHCNTMCRDAQRRHIHESVENGDPQNIWKFLKSLGVGKNSNHQFPSDLNLNDLNNFFCSYSPIPNFSSQTCINQISSLPTPNYPPFTFTQFAVGDVKKIILSITSKAVGTDRICRNMIIPILDIIVSIITHILNFSITSHSFPSIWKDAHVIPLPKKTIQHPSMSIVLSLSYLFCPKYWNA
ncbi:unnamed protein product [Colias eurytheme]|nr:unnamed protein product [Colias eurytheme]